MAEYFNKAEVRSKFVKFILHGQHSTKKQDYRDLMTVTWIIKVKFRWWFGSPSSAFVTLILRRWSLRMMLRRRAFLLKKNMKFQKDDRGVEGVCVPKSGVDMEDEKEIKIGKRLSASKLKQEDYGDGSGFSKEQREAAHRKNSALLAVQSVSQAWGCDMWCIMILWWFDSDIDIDLRDDILYFIILWYMVRSYGHMVWMKIMGRNYYLCSLWTSMGLDIEYFKI